MLPLIIVLFYFSGRVSYLITFAYSLFLIGYKCNENIHSLNLRITFLILVFFPLIVLFSSPSSNSIFLIAIIFNLKNFLKINIVNIFLYLVWTIIFLFYFSLFKEYFEIYLSLSNGVIEAGAIPLKLSSFFSIFIWINFS